MVIEVKARLVAFHFSPTFVNAIERVRLVPRFPQKRVTDEDVSSLQLPFE